jgi:hypothetical protein
MRNAARLFLPGVVLGLLFLSTLAQADTAYITGSAGIYQWDTTTNTATALPGSPTGLDSDIFDTHGNIIYSDISNGSVGLYNPTTHMNTVLNPNAGPGVADMALDPSGTSFLVSDAFGSTITRVDLTTGAIIGTLNVGTRPDGLAYDNSGDLYAVLNTTTVAQINPITGAVMNSFNVSGLGCGAADGLTFDSTTNKLYVSCDNNPSAPGAFVALNLSLTSGSLTKLTFSPDGLASIGNTLYFAQRGAAGIQYDLSTNTITEVVGIPGADDIAPLAGLGSPNPTPEPGTLLLLGSGLTGVVTAIRRKASSRR